MKGKKCKAHYFRVIIVFWMKISTFSDFKNSVPFSSNFDWSKFSNKLSKTFQFNNFILKMINLTLQSKVLFFWKCFRRSIKMKWNAKCKKRQMGKIRCSSISSFYNKVKNRDFSSCIFFLLFNSPTNLNSSQYSNFRIFSWSHAKRHIRK